MGGRRKRGSARALRPAMRSPGHPPGWCREHQEQFWREIARGVPSEKAAVLVGLSTAVRNRRFRRNDEMPPHTFKPMLLVGGEPA
jgi:hypothetical protein